MSGAGSSGAVVLLLIAGAALVWPAQGPARRLAALARPSPAPPPPRGRAAPGGNPGRVAATWDLLAACLRAGMAPAAAVQAVAPHAPSNVAAALTATADRLALGADPDAAWGAVDSPTEAVALAKAVRRAARTGTGLADTVAVLARQERAAAEDAAQSAAARAGVLIAAPLGLCFLPAFLCLGVVPVVAGLGARMLGPAWD